MPNKHKPCGATTSKDEVSVRIGRSTMQDFGVEQFDVMVTPEVLDGWQAAVGPPLAAVQLFELAIETGMMLRLAFHLALRQTEG